MYQIHGLREEKRKVTFRLGEMETIIDFVLTRKEHQRYLQNANPGKFQHAQVVADMD